MSPGASTGPPSEYVLFKPVKIPNGKNKTKTVFVRAAGPAGSLHRAANGNAGLLDNYRGKVPKGWKVLTIPHKTVLITCSAKTTTVCPGETTVNGLPPAGKTDYYLFKHGAYPNDRYGPYPNMKGTELKLSGTRADIDPTQGPIVLMQFTGKGNKAFHQVTKNEATRGSIQQADQHFAIVLDNEIRSWPSISYKDLPNGIDPTGTGAQITGLASFKEASNLALVLQTGALPVNFVPLERTDVSATLGKDSLKQARNAAIGGLIVVALFLLLLYRFLGVVAVIGLAIYGAFMYAAIVLLGVTLTLPGFAGLILTPARRSSCHRDQGRKGLRSGRDRKSPASRSSPSETVAADPCQKLLQHERSRRIPCHAVLSRRSLGRDGSLGEGGSSLLRFSSTAPTRRGQSSTASGIPGNTQHPSSDRSKCGRCLGFLQECRQFSGARTVFSRRERSYESRSSIRGGVGRSVEVSKVPRGDLVVSALNSIEERVRALSSVAMKLAIKQTEINAGFERRELQ